eukprot:Amastigsp_a841263_244.p3 type:complete len:158 gc:universal Amastigsp_a841263_244:150-623(+)
MGADCSGRSCASERIAASSDELLAVGHLRASVSNEHRRRVRGDRETVLVVWAAVGRARLRLCCRTQGALGETLESDGHPQGRSPCDHLCRSEQLALCCHVEPRCSDDPADVPAQAPHDGASLRAHAWQSAFVHPMGRFVCAHARRDLRPARHYGAEL